jgi:hypothetical protein
LNGDSPKTKPVHFKPCFSDHDSFHLFLLFTLSPFS